MSLNWNATKVPAAVREQNSTHLNLAIWNTMAIGVPKLTDANLLDATHRTRLWEALYGAWNYVEDENGQMVPDFLWKRLHLFVGLSTNADKLSTKQFLDKVWGGSVKQTAMHIAVNSLEEDGQQD